MIFLGRAWVHKNLVITCVFIIILLNVSQAEIRASTAKTDDNLISTRRFFKLIPYIEALFILLKRRKTLNKQGFMKTRIQLSAWLYVCLHL